MYSRKLYNRCGSASSLPVNAEYDRGYFPRQPNIRINGLGALTNRGEPLMKTKNGGVIPAAFDPTDPNTWTRPVLFT